MFNFFSYVFYILQKVGLFLNETFNNHKFFNHKMLKPLQFSVQTFIRHENKSKNNDKVFQ
jgi:SRSO17 transposase